MAESERDRNITYGVNKDLTSKSAEELTEEVVNKYVEETRKWIGREIPIDDDDKFRARTPIEPSEIRRFALANRNPNPLYLDRDYAKNTIWGDVIAPPLFGGGAGAAVTGTVPVQLPGLLQAQHWMHSGIEREFFVTVRPGDTHSPRVFFNDCEVKHGNFVGKMFLNSTKTISKNQKGEVLCINKHYDMLYSVQKAKERKFYDFPPEQGYPPLKHEDLGRWSIKRRGATPLYYEDVNIGDELPSFSYGTTVMDIVAAFAGLRVGLEYLQERGGLGCHWHYHPITCFTVRGMPLPFDSGQSRYNFATRLVTDWSGDNSFISKISVQARKPIFAGDTNVVRGKVTAKNIVNDRHCVDVDFEYENQRHDITCKGTITVILPSKKGDAPLLPEQPKV